MSLQDNFFSKVNERFCDRAGMDNINWKFNENIQCQQLTPEYLEQALDLIETAFFPYEPVSRTLRISEDKAAKRELRELTTMAAKDGVTLIAIDQKQNKVVGVAMNKIQVPDGSDFENFAKTWKNSKSQGIASFMAEIDKLCDFFTSFNVDCLLELMFLAVSPEYRGEGIGTKLTQLTIEIVKLLAQGVNVKKSIDGQILTLERCPKIVASMFTTIVTQKIGGKLQFNIAAEKEYKDLVLQNLDFSEVIKSGTSKITLEYVLLKK